MKTASAGLATHLAGDARTLCLCLKLKRVDGTLSGYTDHDADIAFDLGDGDGSVTYQANPGALRTALGQTADVGQIDDVDVTFFLQASAVDPDDLRAGLYDFAEAKLFLLNWADTTQGALKMQMGWLGQVTINDEVANVELLGLASAYERELVELYGAKCFHDHHDGAGTSTVGCGVRHDPPAWAATTAYSVRQARDAKTGSIVKPSTFNDRHFKCTTAGTSGGSEPSWDTTLGNTTSDGSAVWTAERALTLPATVATVTSQREFVLTVTTDAPDGLMADGKLRFTAATSAKLVGLVEDVRSWTLSTKTVILHRDMPFTVTAGDSVELVAGCDQTTSNCKNSFDNIENYGGFPFVPNNDWLFRTPDSPIG